MTTNGLNIILIDGQVKSAEAVLHNSFPQIEGIDFLHSIRDKIYPEKTDIIEKYKEKKGLSLLEHQKVWKCHFVYVADLDTGTFNIYQCDDKTNSIALLKTYSFEHLPSDEEFLKEFETVE